MILRESLYVLDYYKKNTFMGSDKAMYYRVYRVNEGDGDNPQYKLTAVTWRGPYIFDKTPEEEKCYKAFPYSEEGMEKLVAWLNEESIKYNQ